MKYIHRSQVPNKSLVAHTTLQGTGGTRSLSPKNRKVSGLTANRMLPRFAANTDSNLISS